MLIFRSSRSQMFFRIGALRQEKSRAGSYSSSFTEHLQWLLLDFCSSKYFFQLNLVIYCWQSHRFLLRTPLKTPGKPQKQPVELFCEKRRHWKFCKFNRKTSVWKSIFCSFIKKRLQHRCFYVEFIKFLRTPNLKSANDFFWNLFFHLDCPF